MKELSKTEEILLLSIWRLEDQAYGFNIRRHISELLGKDFSYGNLYSSLNQLVIKKYVTKHQGESTPARKGKIRMYYTMTDVGRLALKDAQETTIKLWSSIPKFIFEADNE